MVRRTILARGLLYSFLPVSWARQPQRNRKPSRLCLPKFISCARTCTRLQPPGAERKS
jgi:hypothetical protein